MKHIGRYIIRGLLGRGAMSTVYKVQLPVVEKIAALKLLDPDPLLARLMGSDTLRDLFIAEARMMGGIQHPNVISLLDFDEHQRRPFYVMEFYANSLGGLIGESYQPDKPSRRIRTDQALSYARQTLNGLACLHDAGIIHRDVKPFNLLLTSWDTVKIADLGLSRMRGEVYSGPGNLKVGSPFYAAPEQERDPDSADERADLYPVGVMLYRMLTGQLPQAGTGEGSYPPVSRINGDLDRAWDAFFEQGIAPDPGRRFANARHMLDGLNSVQDHWEAHKNRTCSISIESGNDRLHKESDTPIRLRHKPIKIRPSKARQSFHLDHLWRPASYRIQQFEDRHDGTIIDHSTGLIWQQAGSAFPRTWRQACQAGQDLNRQRHAGLENWRLPTMNELLSLLRPLPEGRDVCITPLFDPTQRWLWSADRRSFTEAYFVDIGLGFAGWQDFSAPYYVRAVHATQMRKIIKEK